MQHPIRFLASMLILAAAAACSLPRGAAIQAEVTRNQYNADAPFSVVRITRENVDRLAGWPATGGAARYDWFARDPGPKSNIVRPGDSIDLVVWDSQENSLLTGLQQHKTLLEGIVVSPAGSIFVPYVDEVPVGGLTPDAARRRIEERLRVVIPDPQVQLVLAPGPDNSVDAVGGFAAPGNYPLPNRNTSIISLISATGGISPSLRNPVVRVIRDGQSFGIRAGDLFKTPSANIFLRGGDQIIAEEDGRNFVALGATGTETVVPFVKQNINAIEALALVSGINESRANPKGVLILRDYAPGDLRADGTGPDKTQVVFAVDLTSAESLFAARKFDINPGDLVLATESAVSTIRTIFNLIGSVVGFNNTLSDI